MPKIKLNTLSYYQKGNFPFPSDDIDPKLKEKPEFTLEWMQAIWSAYIKNETAIPYSSLGRMQELRNIAEGIQDVTKLKKILLDETENGDELTGYMNINWEPIPVMTKFLHIIRSIFEEQEHKCVATAVDPKSTEEREKQKLIKWFKGRYKPIIQAVNEMAGNAPETEWIPETLDELSLYESAGGFKLAKENKIEEALDYTFYISDWKEIKRKQLDDFSTLGCSSIRDYTDQYTQKAKIRYVDPLKLVMQYSKHWDHRNSQYAGELITETIANIRKVTDLSEDDLRSIAQFYNGRYGNQNISNWSDEYLNYGGTCLYDNFHVLASIQFSLTMTVVT